jgi:uncharacterized Zn finger protein
MAGHVHIHCGTCGERQSHVVEKSGNSVIIRCQECHGITHSQDESSEDNNEVEP